MDLDDPSKLKFGWNWSTRGTYRCGPMPGVVLTVEFDGPPADRAKEVTAAEIQESLQRTPQLPHHACRELHCRLGSAGKIYRW